LLSLITTFIFRKLMGALTNKRFAFQGRPWEYKRIYTRDFNEPMASPISVDVRGDQILRILPQVTAINEQWISDRVRFFHDGLNKQRLTQALYRKTLKDPFISINSDSVLGILLDYGTTIHTIVGRSVDNERLLQIKRFSTRSGNGSFTTDSTGPNPDLLYQPDLKIFEELLSANGAFLILNTELKRNYPLLESKLRLAVERNQTTVYAFGNVMHGFAQNLGAISSDLLLGKHSCISLLLQFDKLCIIADDTTSKYVTHILNMLATFGTFTALFNIALPKTLTTINAAYHNYRTFDPFQIGTNDIIILYETDAVKRVYDSNLIVYIGHHGDIGAQQANIVIPNATIFERKYVYTYAFDGKLVKYAQVQNPLIQEVFLEQRPRYAKLFAEEPLPLNEDTHAYIPLGYNQQHYSSLQQDAVTRASPTLALAVTRSISEAEAKNNF
jgi:NADH dehydrogenase/NADH:ubiquinone oxidoreductase subunit G